MMSPRTKVYRKDKIMSENLRHPYPIAKAFTLFSSPHGVFSCMHCTLPKRVNTEECACKIEEWELG
jgi:hypothetical protein